MEADFWHQRWNDNDIAFHQGKANDLLIRHFDQLGLDKNQRVFLPLCGKTRDIAWLLAKGYRITGVELSEKAIVELFEELETTPDITQHGPLQLYQADGIDIFVGDLFDLSADIIGKVDAVYDRAALVALPKEMRKRYTSHLNDISKTAPQLLLCYEYDQSQMKGPPFSISDNEIHSHYKRDYELSLLENSPVKGGLKGICPATEKAWRLTPFRNG